MHPTLTLIVEEISHLKLQQRINAYQNWGYYNISHLFLNKFQDIGCWLWGEWESNESLAKMLS